MSSFYSECPKCFGEMWISGGLPPRCRTCGWNGKDGGPTFIPNEDVEDKDGNISLQASNPTDLDSEIDAVFEKFKLLRTERAYNGLFPELAQATAQLQAIIARECDKARNTIATPCPACGHKSLIISAGNWLVCGNLECNDPAAINAQLKAEAAQKGERE